MTIIEFIQVSVAELNSVMIGDVKTLTQEQLTWKPAAKANPIGFLFWHFMRTEDNAIQSLQGKPSIWKSEKWYQKMGMDAEVSGSGFQEPEVDKAAALPLPEVMAYAERVAQSAVEYIKSLKDSDVDLAPDPSRPKRTIGLVLRNFIIAHGWWHIGEIRYLKGMQGVPASR
ncbi:MAG: DinB family protein [Dehalococcoidales bacterium]|nr:DinB family protein [Dehalococcoidales bacterium]